MMKGTHKSVGPDSNLRQPNKLSLLLSGHPRHILPPSHRTCFGHPKRTPHERHVANHASSSTMSRDPSETETYKDTYGASSIQVLEGLDPVRKRPGMYIGGTGSDGLHHLVWEVVDNCIDEVQAGHATCVEVEVDLGTGWVCVTDDGRGIPVDEHPTTGKSALETVLTVLHAGGKFGGEASGYQVSGGLHGVGVSVVNALSEQLEVTVWRQGLRYDQRYGKGIPLTELTQQVLPPDSPDAGRQGTCVRFLYDKSIFAHDVSYNADVIATRLHELAFLNADAKIRLRATRRGQVVLGTSKYLTGRQRAQTADGATAAGSTTAAAATSPAGGRGRRRRATGTTESGEGEAGDRSGNETANGGPASLPSESVTVAAAPSYGVVRLEDGWQVFQFSGGLKEFVACLQAAYTPLHEPIHVSVTDPGSGVVVQLAVQWAADSYREEVRGFANSIHTVDGGTHLDGFRAGINRTVTALGKKMKLIKDSDPPLSGEHIREGLGAVVAVRLPSPEFEGQTKTRLGNPEVRKLVEAAVSEAVGEWFEARPAAATALLSKALNAARAADAARKARELVRRKTSLSRSTLPGKLADCASEERDETEIYLVEGDSAGGSAKQARDRRFQAVLPLKGKILNVERVSESNEAAMYKNTEISSLIVALGLGTDSRINRGPPGGSRDTGEAAAAQETAPSKALEGLRYGKIVILTDADVDGAHIRALLLTFLFRYRPELFHAGHVYVAVPPLYKVERGRNLWWAHSDAELKSLVAAQRLTHGSYIVQRFKGLGEMMPQQLWDTTLNPATRLLRRMTVRDYAEADQLLSSLMGAQVAPRKALIEEYSAQLGSIASLDV